MIILIYLKKIKEKLEKKPIYYIILIIKDFIYK